MVGRPVSLPPKVPAQAKAGAASSRGKSFAALAARVAALSPSSASRRAASTKSSSSPPMIARPSGVVRH